MNKRILYVLLYIALFMGCSHLKEAKQAFNAGQFDQTIQMCLQALQQDSSDTGAMKLLAGSYFSVNDFENSISWYENLIKANTDVKYAKERISLSYQGIADSLVQDKEYYRAIKALESALEYTPEQKQIVEQLGDVCYQAGLHDKAVEWYAKVGVTADSTKIKTALQSMQSAEEKAKEILQKGLTLKDKKRYSQAREEIEKALELKPDYREAKYQLLVVKAMPLYRKGRKSGLWEAIEYLGEATTLFPERAEPHYYMGMSYNKKDRDEYKNAISEFELAIKTEPNSNYAKLSAKKIDELKKHRKKMQDFLSR